MILALFWVYSLSKHTHHKAEWRRSDLILPIAYDLHISDKTFGKIEYINEAKNGIAHANKATIKTCIHINEAGSHVATAGCLHRTVRIHIQTYEQPEDDMKQTEGEMKQTEGEMKQAEDNSDQILRDVKGAIDTFGMVASFVIPVLSFIPGIGPICAAATTAYKAFSLYKAAETVVEGVKKDNPKALVGGIISACGQLGVPGAEKVARLCIQGGKIVKAIENEDYTTLITSVAQTAGGKCSFIKRGLHYFQKGRTIYKNGKQVYDSTMKGEVSGALNGISKLVNCYAPQSSIKRIVDISKNAFTAHQLIKQDKFGQAIVAGSGAINMVFHTDSTAKFHKSVMTINGITNDMRRGKFSAASQKIGKACGLKSQQKVVNDFMKNMRDVDKLQRLSKKQ
jgi:hypothetical protein